jgi:RND family efflux transporter MFP subunit
MRPYRAAAVCIVAAVTLAACSPREPEAERPRPVRTVIAALADTGEEIVQTGEVQPHVETELGFRIDGRLATRAVDVGATVKKGQLLATIDARDVTNELRVAEADLRSALSSESLAKITLDRQNLLFKVSAVAQAKVEEADTNWRTAVARRESAAATLANARNKLTDTQLFANETGVITAIGASPGQVVTTGQMVVKLASTSERDAVFSVSEKLINGSSPDVKVKVSLVSAPSVSVIGYVRDVSPTAESATRSYRVRIALPDAPVEMAFGATVSGQAILSGDRFIALPAAALTANSGAPAVYVVDRAAGTLQRKPIVVARYTASQIFVASGLRPGDVVVVAGVSKLRPGQHIALGGDAK